MNQQMQVRIDKMKSFLKRNKLWMVATIAAVVVTLAVIGNANAKSGPRVDITDGLQKVAAPREGRIVDGIVVGQGHRIMFGCKADKEAGGNPMIATVNTLEEFVTILAWVKGELTNGEMVEAIAGWEDDADTKNDFASNFMRMAERCQVGAGAVSL